MRIGEAATGIGEQMADTGLAIQRAKDKTEAMTARAGAIDELVESGALEDFTSDQTQLDRARADLVAEPGRLGAREDEGRARCRREAEGAGVMIVRLMGGGGQYKVDDSLLDRLNELDDQAVAALERGDEEELDARLDEMADLVQSKGEPLPEDDLTASDVVIPPSDLTLEETRRLLSEDGLIPDLPAAS